MSSEDEFTRQSFPQSHLGSYTPHQMSHWLWAVSRKGLWPYVRGEITEGGWHLGGFLLVILPAAGVINNPLLMGDSGGEWGGEGQIKASTTRVIRRFGFEFIFYYYFLTGRLWFLELKMFCFYIGKIALVCLV